MIHYFDVIDVLCAVNLLKRYKQSPQVTEIDLRM